MESTALSGVKRDGIAPYAIGDEVELDPSHSRVTALILGESPCPQGSWRGRIRTVADAAGEIAIVLESGEEVTVPLNCLRRIMTLQP